MRDKNRDNRGNNSAGFQLVLFGGWTVEHGVAESDHIMLLRIESPTDPRSNRKQNKGVSSL